MTADIQQAKVEGSKASTLDPEEHQEEKKKTGDQKREAETSNPTSKSTSVVTPGKSSKKIGNPIVSVTPL
jgi:hypothetical protein